MGIKISLVILVLTGIALAIGYLFYTQELQYWKPTPIPDGYVEVPIGVTLEVDEFQTGRKKFIHFYNPNCPCSKFNFQSYKSLLNNYSEDFDCYAVIQESLDEIKASNLDFMKELNVTLIADKKKQIASACGVYATPQIVLLDENNKLYYRGNYNQSRYCTSKATSFAQIAIDSLLVKSQFHFPQSAFTAYGCPLEKHID